MRGVKRRVSVSPRGVTSGRLRMTSRVGLSLPSVVLSRRSDMTRN